jgi:hypothetical protein
MKEVEKYNMWNDGRKEQLMKWKGREGKYRINKNKLI